MTSNNHGILQVDPTTGICMVLQIFWKHVINKESHDLRVITEKSPLVIKQNVEITLATLGMISNLVW